MCTKGRAAEREGKSGEREKWGGGGLRKREMTRLGQRARTQERVGVCMRLCVSVQLFACLLSAHAGEAERVFACMSVCAHVFLCMSECQRVHVHQNACVCSRIFVRAACGRTPPPSHVLSSQGEFPNEQLVRFQTGKVFRVLLDGGKQQAIVKGDGSFTIFDVTEGIHSLEVDAPGWYFETLKLDVHYKGAVLKVRPTMNGESGGNKVRETARRDGDGAYMLETKTVCACTNIHTHTHVICTYTYTHISIYTHIHMFTHTHTHAHMNMCICEYTYEYMCKCVYMCTHVCKCMCMYMYVLSICVCVCEHAYVCVCVYVHIHIHIRILTHARSHIYIFSTCTGTSAYTHTYAYAYTNTYTCMYMYIHVYTYSCVYVLIHIYVLCVDLRRRIVCAC